MFNAEAAEIRRCGRGLLRVVYNQSIHRKYQYTVLSAGGVRIIMDRVQYQLERLLPSLQLLAALDLFSRPELQALTQQRRHYETNLITADVGISHYLDYAKFEEDFERLTSLRVSRAGKDERGNERVVLKDRNKLKRFQERHLISIWQRMVSKLGPKQSDVFVLYLKWLHGRKMRRVYSEVAAQGLSLHPANTDLWIMVADWELNDNLDASAARLTLLRAIRLNSTMTNADAKRKMATRKASARRRKRARKLSERGEEDASDNSDESSGEESDIDDTSAPESSTSSSLSTPERLTSNELGALNLWINYFRMECIFLERLRRRWAVLGITGATNGGAENSPGQRGSSPSTDDLDADGDQGGNARSSELENVQGGDDTQAKQENQSAQATAPRKILSGALLHTILSSALNLQRFKPEGSDSSSGSSPALPEHLHPLFLCLVLRWLGEFCFQDRDSIRNPILDGIFAQIEPILRRDAADGGARPASVPLADAWRPTLLARRAAVEKLEDEEDEGCPQEEVEKRSTERLRRAARLEFGDLQHQRLTDLVSSASDTSTPSPAYDEVMAELNKRDRAGVGSQRAHWLRSRQMIENQLLADFAAIQDTADLLSQHTARAAVLTQRARAMQTALAAPDLTAVSTARLAINFWHALAWRKRTVQADTTEDGDDLEEVPQMMPFPDPMLPYLSGVVSSLLTGLDTAPTDANHEEIAALHLFLSYQSLQHQAALTGADKVDGKLWTELRAQSQKLLKGSTTSLAVYVQALIWTAQESSTAHADQGTKADLSDWEQLLGLNHSRSAAPAQAAQLAEKRRSIDVLLSHVRSQSLPTKIRPQHLALVRRLIRCSREALLTAIRHEEIQQLHDDALLAYFSISTEQEQSQIVKSWTDSAMTSPSLGAWLTLIDLVESRQAGTQPSPVLCEVVKQVQSVLVKRHFAKGEEDSVLPLLKALFQFHLVGNADVKRGLAFFHQAKRLVGSDSSEVEKALKETWISRVEQVWNEAASVGR
ncbi:unnamed protein product [Jaminaea pallidilutea]